MKTKLLLFLFFVGMTSLGLAQNGYPERTDSIGCNSLSVDFSFNTISGTPVSYFWNFGDGNNSTLSNPTHTYTGNGTYYPFVTVSFAGGVTQSFTFGGGPVILGPPTIFQVRSQTVGICEPGFYGFDAIIDTSYIGMETELWTLFYPDGSTQTSSLSRPNFNMNQIGLYTLRYKTWVDPACPDSQEQVYFLDTLSLDPTITDASCGGSDGSILLNPTLGGNTFFQRTIFWSTGDSGISVSNLTPGTIFATVNFGPNLQCVSVDTFEIGEEGVLDYSINSTNVPCEQDSVGAIDITINANDGPVNFLWNTGATTEDLVNIPGGTYTVTITDNSCSFSETIVIDAASLDVSFTSVDTDCSGNGGTLEVFASGAQAPYTYLWSNGVTTSVNPNISAGGYSVVVTDATGCTDREVTFLEAADSCFYTISGKVFYDENANCVFDGNDFYLSDLWMRLNNSNYFVMTDTMGNYEFSVPPGSHEIDFPTFSSPYLQVVCPQGGTQTVNVSSSDVGGLDFSIVSDTNIIDLAAFVSNVTVIRPGFRHRYDVYAYNYGTTPMSGFVQFTMDSLVTYHASSPAATNYDPVTHTAVWTFNNLLPGRWERYDVYASLPPTVALGTPITTYAEVAPITNDSDTANNFFQGVTPVVGSYDPNDKQVLPAGEGPEGFINASQQIMQYNIRFQNTGTFPAEFVILRDTIDSDLRPETVKPIGASHPYKLTMDGNAMEVRFDNIQLPDSASDPDGSQGYFTFVIAHNGELAPLTEITNTAAIYFDFNAPIITNTTLSTIAMPTSVLAPAEDGVLLYPNPTKGIFHIRTEGSKVQQVLVYDISGKLVREGKQEYVDLSDKEPGIYLVQIFTDKGRIVKRVILDHK